MSSTKEHILKVSFGLFLQKSFKEVTMKDIVDATGISKGAIYHYFSSKEELFKEVVETFFLKSQDAFFGNVPNDNLKAFINAYLQNAVDLIGELKKNFGLNSSNQGITYYSMSFDILRLFPEYEKVTATQFQRDLEKWEEVIGNARRSGEIQTAMSDSQLARLFVVINDGLAVKLILQGRIDDLAGEMFTLFNAVYNLVKK